MNEMQKLGSFLGAKFNKILELLDQKSGSDHVHAVATTKADGFMSKDDKVKLDGIGSYEEMVVAFNTAVGEESPFYETV